MLVINIELKPFQISGPHKQFNPRERFAIALFFVLMVLGCSNELQTGIWTLEDTDTSVFPDTESNSDWESSTDTESETQGPVDTDECPNDPDKTEPGKCGCGIEEGTCTVEIPEQLPDPDETPPLTDKPVKVYIMMGQSNMVGMGQVEATTQRHSNFFLAETGDDPGVEVSVYEGAYSPNKDYDKLTPITTQTVTYGGTEPDSFPGGGTQVVRGYIEIGTSAIYEFLPGWADSRHNVMELDGQEVYRKEVGGEPVKTRVNVVADKRYPFKVTFFTNGSGPFWIHRQDLPGTLQTVVETQDLFPHLVDDNGDWTTRNDVLYVSKTSEPEQKWLTVGCGAGDKMGPELQFGHIMGYYHGEMVLIIKAADGNRSLAFDILPPSSEGYQDGIGETEWYPGWQYDDFIEHIHEILDNLPTYFPSYEKQGYEIAGLAWFQGHKDTGSSETAAQYEGHLVNLIHDIRAEFKEPKLPFVIATIGFGGWNLAGNGLTVAKAQLAVSGTSGKYPEFAGNVLTVETRDFWRDSSISPKNQDYHYNQNGETYMLVGDALGRGMVELLNGNGK